MTPAFAPDGLLARAIPGYEPRDGQAEMAAAVEQALADKRHLVVEAPCGIGKTFAYLVPAIDHALRTNSRVVVCTSNIALQEQLVGKDLPLLAKALDAKVTWALIKGLGNYLCLDRFEDARSEVPELLPSGDDPAPWKGLVQWAATTRTGDQSDLPFAPAEVHWGRVNGVPELCTGSECRFYDDCFAMAARRRLRNAHIIVTNYHLYFAHLAVKIAAGRDAILPPHSVVIGDEAHDLADVARDFFGMRLSVHSVNLLLHGANRFRLRRTGDRLKGASRAFFDRVSEVRRDPRYRIRLRRPRFADGSELESAVAELREALAETRKMSPDEATADKVIKFDAAAQRYLETLRAFLELDNDNMVYWIEEDARSTRLVSRLVDVSAILREHLFKEVPSVILTSATLADAGTFDYLKREVGAEAPLERQVASPFNFREQAILIVPPVQAGPNDPGFADEISKPINRVIKRLGGRTMALFTSYRNLERCAEAAKETGVEILVQGQAPRSKLLEAFRMDRGTALFATASFWQGVDIPGEALSCLIIDKIPFTTPEDPLLNALQEKSPDSFARYSLPRAIIALRQGFGRLIRSKADRGVVVIFDNRLHTARYGSVILKSLPDVPIYRDLYAIDLFFGKPSPARDSGTPGLRDPGHA